MPRLRSKGLETIKMLIREGGSGLESEGWSVYKGPPAMVTLVLL